jgi:hypothetical protein
MTTYAEWHEQEQQLSETEYEALTDYLDNEHKRETDEHDDDIVSQFRDAYCGQWSSMADFAEEHTRDCHEIPDWLDRHIDWDSVAQDYEHDYWESDFGHIFRSC